MGRVVRLGVKARTPGERGHPKPEVALVQVSRAGVAGDYNVWRQETKGGDPDYALLILPLETIEAFNREGWPVRPGDFGENVTSSGIPYPSFRPPATPASTSRRSISVAVLVERREDPLHARHRSGGRRRRPRRRAG